MAPKPAKPLAANALRNERIVELSLDGLSMHKIAKEMKISSQTVHAVLHEHYDAQVQISGDEMRRQEDDRLNRVFELALKEAKKGNTAALGIYLKASESRRKMWGLDAPQQTESKVFISEADAQVAELIAQFKASGAEISDAISPDEP